MEKIIILLLFFIPPFPYAFAQESEPIITSTNFMPSFYHDNKIIFNSSFVM
ncbi:MAG: hypothetical protein J4F36_12915 [Nitrosopumilaceae archaeon]|nr:hypothetical protein [Nitrosopumilaceae archaeon]